MQVNEDADRLALVPVYFPEPVNWIAVNDNIVQSMPNADLLINTPVLEEDLLVSRKRRRQSAATVPVPEPAAADLEKSTVGNEGGLRRISRSKRYQGFKHSNMSDKTMRKSHVKPR